MNSPVITHITQRSAWEQAVRDGQYTAPSLESEGFIHCSNMDQVVATAGRYYKGVQGLVLLYIDPTKLLAELLYELAPHVGQYFAHIYGPLNVEAVFRVAPFEPDAEGNFTLPPDS